MAQNAPCLCPPPRPKISRCCSPRYVNGITTTIRQAGTALGPLAAGPLMGVPILAGWCFVISGGLKSVYDLIVWCAFSHVKPPEEQGRG